MPAQKRPLSENSDSDREGEDDLPQNSSSPHQNGHLFPKKQSRRSPPSSPSPLETRRREDEEEEVEEREEEEEEEEKEKEVEDEEEDDDDEKEVEDDEEKQEGQASSDGSESSSSEDEKPEFVNVELREIRKDVRCPICLGIIKKTRTVMECLHRFCRECIDKSMRMGNNECPACRTHCASRRSLRDDPNYDALIAALYPDIDQYEEDELTFHEEEMARNKQIQASIAQVIQRQSEALVRRRSMGKEASPFMTRHQRNSRTRRRRNSRGNDFQGSEDNEDENDENGGKDSSSADEHSAELRQRRRKRRSGPRTILPFSSTANAESGPIENDSEASRENRRSPGLVWNTEMLAWGRGGARSHTRHGNSCNSNNKNAQSARISKLVDYLRSLDEKNTELDVHLKLITVDNDRTPSLQQPYLCCRPSLSVKHLCEYVAHQTPLRSEQVKMMLVKGEHSPGNDPSTLHPSHSLDELQALKEQETLAGLKDSSISRRDYLIVAYGEKKEASE